MKNIDIQVREIRERSFKLRWITIIKDSWFIKSFDNILVLQALKFWAITASVLR